MDPFMTGGSFMPSLTGGGGGMAGPSGARGESMFDSSGWAVNFGSGSASATGGSGLSKYLPYVLAAGAVIVVWRMTRKR